VRERGRVNQPPEFGSPHGTVGDDPHVPTGGALRRTRRSPRPRTGDTRTGEFSRGSLRPFRDGSPRRIPSLSNIVISSSHPTRTDSPTTPVYQLRRMSEHIGDLSGPVIHERSGYHPFSPRVRSLPPEPKLKGNRPSRLVHYRGTTFRYHAHPFVHHRRLVRREQIRWTLEEPSPARDTHRLFGRSSGRSASLQRYPCKNLRVTVTK
jgi:hypothetical protein